RYYVCLNAQQKGWASCPTKSLNAHEIESAVVEHIRGLGANAAIFSKTASEVRARSEKRLAELDTERRAHERELKSLHTKLRALVKDQLSPGKDRGLVTDRMADLQDRIRSLEQRLTAIREEISAIQKDALDNGDLEKALLAFAPVWDSLSPKEQGRIMKLLVERVAYDGRDGNVTVTFRTPGIKALCMGDGMREQEKGR
ncbi:MAG: recombinase family protein, partial [Deltaproteobacteria bacterium]|nr:recombinase family protein [Deltaproteobacteria bacterium]